MRITFSCTCGEILSVDETQAGRKVYCLTCRKSIEIPSGALPSSPERAAPPAAHAASDPGLVDDLAPAPGALKQNAGAAPAVARASCPPPKKKPPPKDAGPEAGKAADSFEAQVFDAPRVDRVPGKNGGERWKLTCFCGKRIHVPFRPEHPVGRCPKCGRRLRLPGYRSLHARSSARKTRQAPAPASAPESARQAPPEKPEKPVPPTPGLAETQSGLKAALSATPGKKLAKVEARAGVVRAAAKREDAHQAGPPPELERAIQELPVRAELQSGSPSSTLDLGLREHADGGASSSAFAVSGPDPEDEIGTIVMDPLDEEKLKQEVATEREAARRTADRMRPHSAVEASGPDLGVVSAWPLAGRLPRVLAGFIDLTFATLLTGFVLGLGSLGVLPKEVLQPAVAFSLFLGAGVLNDGFLQLLGGGLGKRLVVLTLRDRSGRRPESGRILLRGVLKWVLWPGWIVALFDPQERALHDLVCGTHVLKGRSRG